uniref:Phosphatidylinositol specific phospholipase C X domain containing 3 n=1 Tax=Sus scrofa TaxID=9823 RepID=A0A8D0XIK1_PIG
MGVLFKAMPDRKPVMELSQRAYPVHCAVGIHGGLIPGPPPPSESLVVQISSIQWNAIVQQVFLASVSAGFGQWIQSTTGSHDSFSFYIDEASPVGPEQPETVQNFVSVFGTVAKKLMRKWLATQTMNFTGQLGAGIRYFDLRISTKPRDPDNELYFAHGLFSAKVNEGLEEINAFLTDHHKEVVFLDFNHFYGMQKYHHEKLVQMLKDIYGNKMCPAIFAQEVSLKYLWEKDYQVLVFYHSPVALEVPFLWPGQMMPAPWANTTDPEKLIQFLQASITERRKKGSFFISQVVLTPKASTVVKGVASGLRETITERALPAMMQWVRTQKPGESGINIVTADFVELGDFISTVIKLNYEFDEGEANT